MDRGLVGRLCRNWDAKRLRAPGLLMTSAKKALAASDIALGAELDHDRLSCSVNRTVKDRPNCHGPSHTSRRHTMNEQRSSQTDSSA